MLTLLVATFLHPLVIRISDESLLNSFVPQTALGAAIDGHSEGDTDRIFTAANLRTMRSAGLRSLTYRLRTELGVEAWHWNPAGTWSGSRQGYWSSSIEPGNIRTSYGYRLPRRGDTDDQANDDGYSRLDDGDLRTFWKSNPYLSSTYTGEPDDEHPQDVYIDLGRVRPVDTIRLAWGAPYATRFEVDEWTGENQAGPSDGVWLPFPHGKVEATHGPRNSLRLAETPVDCQWVRIHMSSSSHTSEFGSRDSRDSSGYAIREISLGLTANGVFSDWIDHRPDRGQTRVHVSSTDPWHRAQDRDRGTEQPGLDRVIESGLTSSLPVLVPVSTLYGTPDDAARMIRYLEARHIPLRGVELGEEPDGQAVSPEDYAALFLEVASAVRKVDPHLHIGGPSFETIQADAFEFPHPESDADWTSRFVSALRRRDRLQWLQFLSFEFYGWDDVVDPPKQLEDLGNLFCDSVEGLWRAGLPKSVPLYVSEYGWSPYAAWPEVDIDGALYDAELLGQFFTLGGRAAFLYGYEPSNLALDRPGNGWGDNMLFLGDANMRPIAKVARYWSTWMLTHCWAAPATSRMRLYRGVSEGYLRVYPLRAPDGTWSVLLLNLSPVEDQTVQFRSKDGMVLHLRVWQFGRKQYAWSQAEKKPARSEPPASFTVQNGNVFLPAYSLTVARFR